MLRVALHRAEEGLIAAILAAMTLLTFLQVILRYVFNTGLLWALEATLYMFGWLVLLGISYGVRTHAHIGIDAAVRLFPPAVRRSIGIAVVALALVYTGLMLYGAWFYVDRLFILDVDAEDIPIRRWILTLCLPIGFALLAIRLLGMAWRILAGRSPGYELADEAADALRDAGVERTADGAPRR
ncbi:TRAP transporter small permease [Desertibaculum subflavum]|uniref:TRAP transporter small permease n=1 Tax=Desertibaculum subflavum TaxID=2268458 RepID=UPI0034D2D891